ncbi:ribonuclease H-like domain-containing protein [Tanacetum coccineum]|uniref:Ribonuclease H-like domain-containing protein n=1 Tax=Tanacetum coccineum TaxID=301880 RepID=A0ABQ4WMC9_9ASTR
MVNQSFLISNINAVKDNFSINAKVDCLWRQYYYGGDTLASMDMILMDQEGSRISATIVVKNNAPYKVDNHPFKINFHMKTKVKAIQLVFSSKCGFSFVPFTEFVEDNVKEEQVVGELIAAVGDVVHGERKNLNLFSDVIRLIAAVGDVVHGERKGKKNRRMVLELTYIEGLKLKCTLWDAFIDDFKTRMKSSSDHIKVLLARGGDDTSSLQVSNLTFESAEVLEEKSFFYGMKYVNLEQLMDVVEPCACVALATITSISYEEGWVYIACCACNCKAVPNDDESSSKKAGKRKIHLIQDGEEDERSSGALLNKDKVEAMCALNAFCGIIISVVPVCFSMAPEIYSSSKDVSVVFGDELFLHPNDVTTTPLISVKLTGTEIYNIWSCAMKHVIGSKNKLGFLDDTCKRPDDSDPLVKQWDMCNSVETYDKVDGSVTFNLHKSINSLSQNGMPLSDYYHKLNSLWRQFDALTSLPACSCTAKKEIEKHNQLIKLMQFLMGLDDVYFPIRSNILTRDPLPSVKSAFAIIFGEESHRGVVSNNTPSKPHVTAFVSKDVLNLLGIHQITKKPNGQASKGLSQNKFASKNNAVSERPSTSSPVSLTNEQMIRLMNLINGKPASPISANKAGTFFNGSLKFNTNFQKFFNSNNKFRLIKTSNGWIIYSGENQHTTISKKLLHNIVDIAHLGLTVGHPNDTHALIHKIGDLKLTKDITLYDVLVVPEYNVSLLSAHKLARDSKLCVGFDEHKCYIQDLQKKEIVEIGNESGGLYLFNVDSALNCKTSADCPTSICYVSKNLWHQRLGHPAD